MQIQKTPSFKGELYIKQKEYLAYPQFALEISNTEDLFHKECEKLAKVVKDKPFDVVIGAYERGPVDLVGYINNNDRENIQKFFYALGLPLDKARTNLLDFFSELTEYVKNRK